jgi:hypothetical protein
MSIIQDLENELYDLETSWRNYEGYELDMVYDVLARFIGDQIAMANDLTETREYVVKLIDAQIAYRTRLDLNEAAP